jgi:hypothetical protein
MMENDIVVATTDRPAAAPGGAAGPGTGSGTGSGTGPGTGPGTGSVRREWRAATRAQGVADLLHRRPDLAGTYLPADLTAEAVRWSA